MDRPKNIILALSVILTLSLFVLLARCPKAECGQDGGDLPDQNNVEPIMIVLSRLDVNDLIIDVSDQSLDVNDQTLELCYKIKNDSDQDVWICDSVRWVEDEFEMYLKDYQTLLIRRRLDVPTMGVYFIWPSGRYSRLRAGEERSKSLSITLPVHHHWMFTPGVGTKNVFKSDA